MAKKIFLSAIILLITQVSLSAGINLDHSAGMYRIPEAYNLGKGQFTLDFRFLYNYYDFEDSFPTTLTYFDTTWTGGVITDIDTTYRDTVVHSGDAIIGMSIPFGISYAITDADEIGLGGIFYYDFLLTQDIHLRPDAPGIINNQNVGNFQYYGRANIKSSGIGDFSLFYKRTIQMTDNFFLGGLIKVIFPTASERTENLEVRTTPDTVQTSTDDITWDGGVFRNFRKGFGGGISLLGTLKPSPESPLSFTGMAGYSYFGYDKYQIVNLGLGIEFQAKYFEPFVEITTDIFMSPDSISSPVHVTPGFRISSLPGLYFDVAYDFRLTSNNEMNVESYGQNPEWTASVGVGYSHDFIPPVPDVAEIAGIVIDAETELPITDAVVTFSDTLLPTIITTDDGLFYIDDIPSPIDFIIDVSAEGYLPAAAYPLILYPGDSVGGMVFRLYEEIIQGRINGIVYEIKDEGTTEPIVANITVSGDTNLTYITEADGSFGFVFLPGNYTVEAAVDGYHSQSKDFTLLQDQTITTEFNLLQESAELVFHDINFEVAKSDLLPSSYPILDKLAIILKDNPSVIIEVQGHTDSDGSSSYNQRLSEARANSVRDYLINVKGISATRLIARGYGEANLMISPERNSEDKRLNRRVEFHVVGN